MFPARGRASRTLLFAHLALLLGGCRRTPSLDLPSNPAPAVAEHAPDAGSPATHAELSAGSIRATHAGFTFAIYYPSKPRLDPLAALRALPEAKPFTILTEFPSVPPGGPALVLLSPSLEEMPPSAASLKYGNRGLDDAQQKAFLAAAQVTVLAFRVGGDTVDAMHVAALRLVGALARQTGGLPWDDATREVFSLERWQNQVDAFENGIPVVARHIRIDIYRDGELLRLVTLGMQKM